MITYLENVVSLNPESLTTPRLGELLGELTQRQDRVKIKAADLTAASALVRTEFLKRLTLEGLTSMKIEDVGLITKSSTDRIGSADWGLTHRWLVEEQSRIVAAGGSAADIFAWVGRTISKEMAEAHLKEHGTLPAGCKVSQQTVLTFRPTKE